MDIKNLKHTQEKAVIINCGTSLSATLSILSVLRYCNIPLLVVNCKLPSDINNGEYQYLQKLQEYVKLQELGEFEIVELELRFHGEMLDYLFSIIPADYLLLVDSDLEVLNSKALEWMRAYLKFDRCYGSGFIHGPFSHIRGSNNGYYAERMWIPFSFLNVQRIREALNAGKSFNIVKKWNDFPFNAYLSKKIYKYVIGIKIINLFFNLFRKRYDDLRPSVVLFDTGAEIYKWHKKRDNYFFGVSASVSRIYVSHYDGITRSILGNDKTATQFKDAKKFLNERLMNEFKFDYKTI